MPFKENPFVTLKKGKVMIMLSLAILKPFAKDLLLFKPHGGIDKAFIYNRQAILSQLKVVLNIYHLHKL